MREAATSRHCVGETNIVLAHGKTDAHSSMLQLPRLILCCSRACQHRKSKVWIAILVRSKGGSDMLFSALAMTPASVARSETCRARTARRNVAGDSLPHRHILSCQGAARAMAPPWGRFCREYLDPFHGCQGMIGSLNMEQARRLGTGTKQRGSRT